jgi:hypothetical protein
MRRVKILPGKPNIHPTLGLFPLAEVVSLVRAPSS